MSLISIYRESEGGKGGGAREAAKLGCGGCSFLLNCPDSITQWREKKNLLQLWIGFDSKICKRITDDVPRKEK